MLYSLARFLLSLYYCFFYRIKVISHENIPETGGFVLCSNHSSLNDPIILAIALKRQISFVGKKELFKNKIFGFLLKKVNVIPVDRETADMTTFKTVISELRKGKCIGIFAQGTRIKEIDANGAKAGVALFALKGNAPIIPVCISATYKHFSKVYVNIGKPMPLDEYKGAKIRTDGLNEITKSVMNTILDLEIKGI